MGPNTPVSDTTLTGFLTPSTLPITGKVFISAQEGDAVISGDQFLFGKNTSSLSIISGPNNPANNFFASQINNENGLIDTSGTFGTHNANATSGTNISAGRQGWDITAVDVSSHLEVSQSSAVFRFTSFGDLYVPNALATTIDYLITGFSLPDMQPGDNVKVDYTVLADKPKTQDNVSNFASVQYNVTDPISGPKTISENTNTVNFAVYSTSLTNVKTVDKGIAIQGDILKYSSVITNTGSIQATNLIFKDILQPGISFIENSVYIDGVNYPGYNPISSFSLSDLNPGESHNVEFSVLVL